MRGTSPRGTTVSSRDTDEVSYCGGPDGAGRGPRGASGGQWTGGVTVPSKPLAALQEQVGTTHTTVEGLTVEAGKVEEFARAVGDDNPAHRESDAARDQGFEAIPAPLTFLRTSYFPRFRPTGIDVRFGFDLGFRAENVLHGEQTYEFERPVRVGDELSGETTLVDVYQRDGRRGGTMTFAVFETEFRDATDDLVCTERITRIETGGGDETAREET